MGQLFLKSVVHAVVEYQFASVHLSEQRILYVSALSMVAPKDLFP